MEILKQEQRFLNRELSDLAFIERVCEESGNPGHPIIERLRFLGISSELVGEFYRIRVAGLRRQIQSEPDRKTRDGLSLEDQLQQVDVRANSVAAAVQNSWLNILNPLNEKGINIRPVDTLSGQDRAWLDDYFLEQIFPAVVPLMIDPEGTFPFIADGDIFLIVESANVDDASGGHALITLPHSIDRFIPLPSGKNQFLMLEDIIAHQLRHIFPGMEIRATGLGRVIREGDLQIADDAEDLVISIKDALMRRERARVVRLEITNETPEHLRRYLAENLRLLEEGEFDLFDFETEEVAESAYIEPEGILGLTDCMAFADRLGQEVAPELSFPPLMPECPAQLSGEGIDMFEAIKKQDILLHWPYQRFDVIVKLLEAAAVDPDVIAIRQTLYRAGKRSPVVDALIEAAENGKSVTVVVELEARDDERENIALARRLEKAGAQVIYGFMGKKVHAKILSIFRREVDKIQTYVHIATGNYHVRTAKAYSDLSILSADPELGQDSIKLFNYISGHTSIEDMAQLSVAPVNLRETLVSHIEKEAEFARDGKPGTIWIKMNRITDPELIDALYEASSAGVKIEMIIRGICCLKSGVKGLSENISVKSIVGRFLEHSRILCFGNGGGLPSDESNVFLTSADWMTQKMESRVELLYPVNDSAIKKVLVEEIFGANRKDSAQSYELFPDGQYKRMGSEDAFCAQSFFLDRHSSPERSGQRKAKL